MKKTLYRSNQLAMKIKAEKLIMKSIERLVKDMRNALSIIGEVYGGNCRNWIRQQRRARNVE